MYLTDPQAALLALVAHLSPDMAPADELAALPFFRQFTPCESTAYRVRGWLSQMQQCAATLATAPANAPAKYLLKSAELSILSGLRAFLAATGCPEGDDALLLREGGRLVVKNAFPRAVSCYVAGSYGDFTVHRLPLQGYTAGPHVAGAEIQAQKTLAQALAATRKCKAVATRQQVQENPNSAIRNPGNGQPVKQWKKAHWQQITWRLGYTTVFDLLVLAASDTADTLAQPALLPALQRLAAYYQQLFMAYLAPGYAVTGEAYFVQPRAACEAQRQGLGKLQAA